MAQSTADWHINHNVTNDEAYAMLSRDPVWNCFALADLEPPWREYSQFATAYQEESNEYAICLILRHPIVGQVLSPFGMKEGVAAILKYIALPERPLIQAQEMHISSLQHYYRPQASWKSMLRMTIPSTSLQLLADVPRHLVEQLTVSDIPALRNIYAQHDESMFSADLFTQGIYVGVREGERIIAAGGTHVLAPTYQVAVLGNIFTAPYARRQGHATAITATLVLMLFEQGYSTVVLNVFEDNSDAIHIYQRIGFQTHQKLLSGKAIISG